MKANRDKLERAFARACKRPHLLAMEVGIGRAAMDRVMVGLNVKPATLERVARALGVDVTDIMQQEG